MSSAPTPRSVAAGLTLVLATGCGGAVPLLHPAHVLPEGEVSGALGVSGQLLAGDAATAITSARQTTVQGAAPVRGGDDLYRRGALAIAALAPGVAPFVGARVGIPYDSEGGISYTSHALRVDARHAFQDEKWAFSIGAGGTALLARPGGTSADLAGLDAGGVSGGGFDVPILAGWRSDAGLVSIWAGARGGHEWLHGDVVLADAPGGGTGAASIQGKRLFAGGVLGFRFGFRHVFAAMELDAAYQQASATFTAGGATASADVHGVSLAPSGAIVGQF